MGIAGDVGFPPPLRGGSGGRPPDDGGPVDTGVAPTDLHKAGERPPHTLVPVVVLLARKYPVVMLRE